MKNATEVINHSISYLMKPHRRRLRPGMLAISVMTLVVSLLLPSAQAQTNLTLKPIQVRVEEPTGFSGSYFITNCNLRVPTNGATGLDGTGTNWIIANANVSISGAPAGVTASLVNSDLVTPVGSIPINMNTNNASKSTNLVIRLDFDGSQTSGVTTLTITASGAGLPDDPFLLPLEVGKIWNGSALAGVNGAGNWSDASQWLGGVPGPNDSVVFTDLGTQTNTLLTSSTSTNLLTNSIVDVTTTIASLRFSQTNGTGTPLTNNHNLAISPGVTLAIRGNEGFKLLRDYTFWTPKMNVAIFGTNGTLVQTNENSSFAILTDGATGANAFEILDMSRLSNLRLDVNNVNIGNIFGYPNYLFFATNGYNSGSTLGSSRPQKIQPTWNMALTNVVKAVFADPFNYANASSRDYAMVIGHNDVTGGSSGNDQIVSMGASNAFFMDGICIGAFGSLGAVLNFQNTNSYAIFRGTNGGRMSVFTCGDAAGTVSLGGSAGVNTKCGNSGFGVDFTKGTVDILVDRFYMSMDRGIASGGGGQVQSSLGMSSGIIDANNAFIGYQASGNQTNVNNCQATLTVSTSAVFRVNSTLALGYTASTAGDPSSPQTSFGRINIGPGGTVIASNITVGGITKATVGNNIALTSGASLIVSNGIADATPGGALGTLSFGGTGNCSLTLFIDGTHPAALVYVTNLTAAGVGNKLVIGGVKNLTFPADVPLIAGAGVTAISPAIFDGGVQMPAGSGLNGTLSLSSSNTINVHIINRTPNTLVWRGPGSSASWDYTAKNWLDVNTGIMTNYDNPDIVSFDDTPGFATTVNIAGATPLTPGAVNMTNNTVSYTIADGGNTTAGSPAFNKFGTGNIEIDANTTFSVQLGQGQLTGSGSIGGDSVSPGAVMNYTGAVGGSVIASGTATIGGIVSGSLTVLPGGVVTNNGTISNPFQVQTNGYLYNSGALRNIGVGTAGSAQVASGAILVNAGIIGDDPIDEVLFVNGTFEDLGTSGMTLLSMAVGTGGTFIPGGDGIGTTTINSDSAGTAGTFPGAALLTQGSMTVFKVNAAATPANTVVSAGHLSFGASASQQTQTGGTLIITNIGVTPFAAGQSFQLFQNSFTPATAPFNTGTSTNTFPTIIPATPGPGLVWDLRNLWVPNASGNSGVIGIVGAFNGPQLTNSFAFDSGTNIIATLSWDPANIGMRLQTLVVPNTVGLTPNTNYSWTGINGSWTNTSMVITNTLSTNDVFFRLSFP